MRKAIYNDHHIGTIALAPILLAQGLRVRRRVPKLPEPPGDRTGSFGQGPLMKLLVLGDSAAAGVGADRQADALTGQIVKNLAGRFLVEWTLFARTGATTSSTLDSVRKLRAERFDVVVTSLGVNDVTSRVSAGRWLQLQTELRTELRNRFDAKQMIVSGLPPVGKFPALPQPLRWYLGGRAKLFDRLIYDQLSNDSFGRYLSIDFSDDMSLMASDGFHPGPKAYALWGEMAARMIDNDFFRDR